tara:strand:+ start:31 stop:207 length:177 start_codon:yes stop_codon:yes gene_type:complete
MSWQYILKYNRNHYVRAGRKHNDPKTISVHQRILEIVNDPNIPRRELQYRIKAILEEE